MVNVLIATDSRYPVNRKIIRKAVFETFIKHKIEESNAEVSVAVVGQRKMKYLCDKYIGDNKDHEILTFALEEIDSNIDRGFVKQPDGVLRLGDIILCWPLLLEIAASDDVLVDEKVYDLVSHGVEHLLGEHHE